MSETKIGLESCNRCRFDALSLGPVLLDSCSFSVSVALYWIWTPWCKAEMLNFEARFLSDEV